MPVEIVRLRLPTEWITVRCATCQGSGGLVPILGYLGWAGSESEGLRPSWALIAFVRVRGLHAEWVDHHPRRHTRGVEAGRYTAWVDRQAMRGERQAMRCRVCGREVRDKAATLGRRADREGLVVALGYWGGMDMVPDATLYV